MLLGYLKEMHASKELLDTGIIKKSNTRKHTAKSVSTIPIFQKKN